MSWTKVFVSRAVAVFERSWDSFARRHGWRETWTLGGRGDGPIVTVKRVDGRSRLLRIFRSEDYEVVIMVFNVDGFCLI